MTLGEKIYRLRTEQGFSQETFGERLGVSRQSVSKWETDQSVPELDKIVAISEMFGVSTDSLLKETAETQMPEEETPPRAGELAREVYRRDRRTHFEYKSQKKIGNLPLVHINLGIGVRPAKGVIAIGTVAQGWPSDSHRWVVSLSASSLLGCCLLPTLLLDWSHSALSPWV